MQCATSNHAMRHGWPPLAYPIRFLTDSATDSSPSFLFSCRNLFILGDFNCRHPLWDSKGTSDPMVKKYSIESSLPASFLLMTSIPQLVSIAPLAANPLLTYPLLSFLLPFLAPGRCFRTWALIIHQFY